MNIYKINVKCKAMNLHSKFYILFVYNRRKMTKNRTFEETSESILSHHINLVNAKKTSHRIFRHIHGILNEVYL